MSHREVLEFIGTGEVITSSTLQRRLVSAGMTPHQARQRMSRSAQGKTGLWRSDALSLPHNERFFAKSDFVGTLRFLKDLGGHLATARPGLARCLSAASRQSFLLEYEVARLSAALVENSPGAKVPTLHQELAALEEAGFRLEAQDTGLARLVQSTANSGAMQGAAVGAAAKRAAEAQITSILGEHYRRQNVISWSSLQVPDSQTGLLPFNGFAFSGLAHSWLMPLQVWKKDRKPHSTPVLFDVYARPCHLEDVAGFAHRLNRARYARSLAFHLLGVIAATEFTSDAFDVAKQNGMVVVNLRAFLGDAALNALAALERILAEVGSRSADVEDSDIDVAAMLRSIRTHPLVSDIKGKALEAVAAFLTKSDGWEDIRLGVDVPFKGNTRDVDVLGIRDGGDRLIAIECKAHGKNAELPRDEVKKFFSETIPALVRSRSTGGVRPSVTAQIWTTGRVGEEAAQLLANTSLPKGVKASIHDLHQLTAAVPRSLKRQRELLQAISEL